MSPILRRLSDDAFYTKRMRGEECFINLGMEVGKDEMWSVLKDWKAAAPKAGSQDCLLKCSKVGSPEERRLFARWRSAVAAIQNLCVEKGVAVQANHRFVSGQV